MGLDVGKVIGSFGKISPNALNVNQAGVASTNFAVMGERPQTKSTNMSANAVFNSNHTQYRPPEVTTDEVANKLNYFS